MNKSSSEKNCIEDLSSDNVLFWRYGISFRLFQNVIQSRMYILIKIVKFNPKRMAEYVFGSVRFPLNDFNFIQ